MLISCSFFICNYSLLFFDSLININQLILPHDFQRLTLCFFNFTVKDTLTNTPMTTEIAIVISTQSGAENFMHRAAPIKEQAANIRLNNDSIFIKHFFLHFPHTYQLYNYAYHHLTSGSRDKCNENYSIEVRGYDTGNYH